MSEMSNAGSGVAVGSSPPVSSPPVSSAAGVAEAKGHGDGMLVRLIKRGYEPLLQQAMRHRIVVLGGSGVLAAGALLLASTFGTSFLPTFREGTYTVFLMAPPGTSLGESDRLARGARGARCLPRHRR